MPPQIVLIGASLVLIGSVSYIRDTLRGRNKPNRVTWLMWAMAPILGAIIGWTEGVSFWEGLPVFMAGFIPLIIFTASFFNKNSYWKLTIFDYICGTLSALALIFWLFADSPVVALALAIIADALAGLPTIRKTWLEPKSESLILYIFSCIDKILGFLILQSWAFINSGFLITVFLQSATLVVFILFHKPKAKLIDKRA